MTFGTPVNCLFHTNGIDDDLRSQLRNCELSFENRRAADNGDLRGVAVLELGNLDIELNIGVDEGGNNTPTEDFFICINTDAGWESQGYVDEWLSVGDMDMWLSFSWGDDTWQENLFNKMLGLLSAYVGVHHGRLKYMSTNEEVF